MKYTSALFIAFALLFIAPVVHAEITLSEVSQPTSFTVDLSYVTRSIATEDVRFLFEVLDIQNPQNIAYWKIRSYCDEDMRMGVVASSTDECGEAVDFKTLPDNRFAIWFENMTNTTRNFSIKLKAYDSNGKWLHTEQKSFMWK